MPASPGIKFSFGPLPPAIPPSPSAPALFDGWAMVFAHVLGGPLGSCTILAMNFRRLGQRKSALITIALGLLLMIALLIAADRFFALLVAATIAYFEEGFQRSALERSIHAGTPLRSFWLACLIGLACGMLLLVCKVVQLLVRT